MKSLFTSLFSFSGTVYQGEISQCDDCWSLVGKDIFRVHALTGPANLEYVDLEEMPAEACLCEDALRVGGGR